MRNYFKMMCQVTHGKRPTDPDNILELCIWGGNDAQLGSRLLQQMQYYREIYPTIRFTTLQPQKFYFDLNQLNFGHLLTGFLSGGGGDFGQWVLGNVKTALPFDYSEKGEYFYAMTQNEEEGSPRKTWSHGV